MNDDLFSARTRRRLAHSPYAPIEGDDVLRTPVLAELLLHRLVTLGPMAEGAAVVMLESRAPGRADETISWAKARGMLTRTPPTDDEPATLEAAGSPRSLAA